MLIYIVRDEDSLSIQAVYFDRTKAEALRNELGSYYEVAEFETHDDMPNPQVIYLQNDNGSEELHDAPSGL